MTGANPLVQLESWIDSSLDHLKSPYTEYLTTLEASNIARIASAPLMKLCTGAVPLTGLSGSIGKALTRKAPIQYWKPTTDPLTGEVEIDPDTCEPIQTLEYVSDDYIAQREIKTGWVILKCLLAKGIIIKYWTNKDDMEDEKACYMVMINDDITGKNDFFDALIMDAVYSKPALYAEPVTGQYPVDRKSLRDNYGGELISGLPVSLYSQYNGKDLKFVNKIVNQQQKIALVINDELLTVAEALNAIGPDKKRGDEIFELTRLKLTDAEAIKYRVLTKKKRRYDELARIGVKYSLTDEQSRILSILRAKLDSRKGRQRESNIVLGLARKYAGTPWFEYYGIDWRMRLYAKTHYLNHQGCKLAKALIKFHKKKRLGAVGWNYLLLSTANVWGEDKLTKQKRIDFAEDNLDEWMIWASDPIKHREWTKADDPWGFLAHILEIKKAIDSGDEYNYESNLPIGLDASVSGLQLYSGLSRSSEGELCNMMEDIFGDYYLHIAEHVWKDDRLPLFWKQKYSDRRSACKRSCMVRNYAAGPRICGVHIWKDHRTKEGYEHLTKEDCMTLGELIHEYCEKLMPGVTAIMNLFQDIAVKFNKRKKDVVLKMPFTGFKFLMHKRKQLKKDVTLFFGGQKIQAKYISSRTKVIDKGGTISSIAPCIIHCLDATLMFMFLDAFKKYKGDDCLANHDCIYMHAANAEFATQLWKQCFLKLIRSNILENICRQLHCMDLYKKYEVVFGNENFDSIFKNDWFLS